ncbi:MAG: Trm112 family protein [Antricoccus sp.]
MDDAIENGIKNQISSQLMQLLACPAPHHAPLKLGKADGGEQTLTCTECGRVFPVVDGIPVLLLDEATRPDQAR